MTSSPVDHNPYSAPKASVADPAPVPIERPREVTRAVQLLWLSFGASVLSEFVGSNPEEDGSGSILIGVAVLLYGVAAWLIFKIARGRSWARAVYVVLALVGYVAIGFFWEDYSVAYKASAFDALLDILTALTDFAGIYLLFTKPARAWFGPRAPSSGH